MWWLLLIAVCGCNSVFGIRETQLFDGRPPATCPALGIVPTFSQPAVVVTSNRCDAYVPSEAHDIAMADCLGTPTIGPADTDMLTGVVLNPGEYFTDARLAPEGTTALAVRIDVDRNRLAHEVFSNDGTAWGRVGSLPFAINQYPGAPSRWAADPHVILATDGSPILEEHALVGTTWTTPFTYDPADQGLVSLMMASLTPDGLRMVAVAYNQADRAEIVYADRPAVTERFTGFTPLTVSQVANQNPYLTEDCGQLYFSDGTSIYYAAQ